MKKNLILLALLVICSCDILNMSDNAGDDNGTSSLVIEAEELSGLWRASGVKVSPDDEITYGWRSVETSVFFMDGALCESKGKWGNKKGYYNIDGNTVTIYVDSSPYLICEFLSLEEYTATTKLTVVSSGLEEIIVWEKATSARDEETANQNLIGSYLLIRDFVLWQHYIEYNALNGRRNEIGAISSLLTEAWVSAHKAITMLNRIISIAQIHISYADWARSCDATARALRAFVYYNMVVLWGDVPYADENHENFYTDWGVFGLIRTNYVDVLNAEIQSVLSSVAELKARMNIGNYEFLPDAAYMLLAEIYLTLSDTTNAQECLAHVNATDASGIFSVALDGVNTTEYLSYKWLIQKEELGYLPIYKKSTADIYKKEAYNGMIDITAEWADEPQYGYWAALKRAGKCQAVTGCEEHETLMPISQRTMDYDKCIKQNPGY